MTAAVKIFEDAQAIGDRIAAEIVARINENPEFVLGCPTGRSPHSTYRAFAHLAAGRQLDCSRLHLIMMDEFLQGGTAGWEYCPRNAHYSCRRFAEQEIRGAINANLPTPKQIPESHIHFPDPGNPAAYEHEIEELGGIDLFLIASGASDGHVAFNPPGTSLSQRTYITELALSTRRDNLATFPGFKNLQETPSHGITVGPGTITAWSRAAIMILAGAHKAEAFRRIAAAKNYEPSWPATVIHACSNAVIYADRMAAGK